MSGVGVGVGKVIGDLQPLHGGAPVGRRQCAQQDEEELPPRPGVQEAGASTFDDPARPEEEKQQP